MAIVYLEGQKIPISDAIASQDKLLKEALNLFEVEGQTASIERTEESGQLVVRVVKPADPSKADLWRASDTVDVLGASEQPGNLKSTYLDKKKPSQQQSEESMHVVHPASVLSESEHSLHFKAVGWVRGLYLKSEDSFSQGTLLLDDGVIAPTNLLGSAAHLLNKHGELLTQPQIWTVYPRTKASYPPYLQFAIRGIRSPKNSEERQLVENSLDWFKISGIIAYQDTEAGKFAVRIYRNVASLGELAHSKDKPVLLTLTGVLPVEGSAVGQFWEMHLRRESDRLVLQDATFVARVFPPKASKKGKKQRRSKTKSKAKNQEKS